jgi:hypothetical protein
MTGRCLDNGWGAQPDPTAAASYTPSPPLAVTPGRNTIWVICIWTGSAWCETGAAHTVTTWKQQANSTHAP